MYIVDEYLIMIHLIQQHDPYNIGYPVVVVSYAHSSGVRGPLEGSGVPAVSFWLFVSS